MFTNSSAIGSISGLNDFLATYKDFLLNFLSAIKNANTAADIQNQI